MSQKEFTLKKRPKNRKVGEIFLDSCWEFQIRSCGQRGRLLVGNHLVSLQEHLALFSFLCCELISSQWPEMIAVSFNLTGTQNCLFIPLFPLLVPVDTTVNVTANGYYHVVCRLFVLCHCNDDVCVIFILIISAKQMRSRQFGNHIV